MHTGIMGKWTSVFAAALIVAACGCAAETAFAADDASESQDAQVVQTNATVVPDGTDDSQVANVVSGDNLAPSVGAAESASPAPSVTEGAGAGEVTVSPAPAAAPAAVETPAAPAAVETATAPAAVETPAADATAKAPAAQTEPKAAVSAAKPAATASDKKDAAPAKQAAPAKSDATSKKDAAAAKTAATSKDAAKKETTADSAKTPLTAASEMKPQAGVIDDGDYAIRSILSIDSVLDVAGGSKAAGTKVWLYTWNNTAAQKWHFAYNEAGYYTITSLLSGMALEVKNASKAAGAALVVNPSKNTVGQRWEIVKDGEGYRIISALKSDFVIDVYGASTEDGNKVWMYNANGTNAQRFDPVALKPDVAPSTATVADGAYVIRAKSSNKSLDVAGGSRDAMANVQQYVANNTYAQRFYLRNNGAGYYEIFNISSGLALDVAGANVMPGSNVWQYTPNGTDAQLWSISKNSDGTYTFTCKAAGTVLDVAGNSKSDGANIWAWTSNDTPAQHFTMTPADLLSEGFTTMYAARSISRVVDVPGASRASGTHMQLYTYNGTPAQKFKIEPQTDGTYALRSIASGLYVVPNATGNAAQSSSAYGWTATFSDFGNRRGVMFSATDGKRLTATASADTAAVNVENPVKSLSQVWLPKSVDLIESGWYLIEAGTTTGKYLEIQNASRSNGANVGIYQNNHSGAQVFYIQNRGDGTYSLIAGVSDKCVDVDHGYSANGTNVWQWTNNGTGAQIWKADFNDAGYVTFQNKATGKMLNVGGNSGANNANVNIWEKNGQSGQNWRLVPTTDADIFDSVVRRAMDIAEDLGSSTDYLVTVDLTDTRVVVFKGSRYNWNVAKEFACSVGTDETPTITGDYTIGDKGYSFSGDDYTCYYYSQIYGDYLFHSVLYYTATGEVKDGRLNRHLSHGCVRLAIENAKWLQDTVPSGSHVKLYW